MRNFRLLKADEIECRISTVSEKGVSLLLYKTARTDYQLLDECVGMFNWQNKYEVIDGKMYCGIGIRDNGMAEWIWKWNCGVESNTEAEKGQASDAMKRAGFCWGIGTELYSAPFIWIPADKCNIVEKNGKFTCFDKFILREIHYTEDEVINSLIITRKGEEVFTFGLAGSKATRYLVDPQDDVQAPTVSDYPPKQNASVSDSDGDFVPKCKDCGKTITVKVHDYSAKKFGVPLCMECQKSHGR